MTSEWQPIEAAPKDGTDVLLHIEGVVIEGRWYRPYYEGAQGRWDVVGTSSHGCGCCSSQNDDPIAWMPLPPPPRQP